MSKAIFADCALDYERRVAWSFPPLLLSGHPSPGNQKRFIAPKGIRRISKSIARTAHI
jgi:hypothetical protein